MSHVRTRWLIGRDMQEVMEIERASFEFPWTEQEFLACLRNRNCIGMVAERDDRIVGFMVYELHNKRLDLLNVAVALEARRTGIGREMMRVLVGKLDKQLRTQITSHVRESNLDAQRFFRVVGFRAIGVIRDRYTDTAEDAYAFRYSITKPAGVNRLAGLIGS